MRVLATLLVLDSLCAAVAVTLAPALFAPPEPETAMVGGVCVEVVEETPHGVTGRVISDEACR